MVKKVRGMLKSQKGLTLVELLAVIVILGIIAAIAVPSIGGIINNSKKDAHIANAQQMVNAARMAVTSGEIKDSDTKITLEALEDGGYLETVKSPGNDYNTTNSFVTLTRESNGTITYKVTLDSTATDTTKILDAKDPSVASRSNVTLE